MSTLLEWAIALPTTTSRLVTLENLPGMTLMTLIASKNDMSAFFSLLSRIDQSEYVNVLNSPDAYGNTPLHYFALGSNKTALEALVNLGASLKTANHAAQTPTDVCKSGSLQFIE